MIVELKKAPELSYRPLCLNRVRKKFEVYDHMVYSISSLPEFMDNEGSSLPINANGELRSIPIGGACSLCGCSRYIYIECPLVCGCRTKCMGECTKDNPVWKGLAYHECPKVSQYLICIYNYLYFKLHESVASNIIDMTENFQGWEERQKELWVFIYLLIFYYKDSTLE